MNIANNVATRSSESPKPEAALRLGSLANDEGVFQRLLENHLPRVRSIVERIRRRLPSTIEADDLYSIGVTGLVAVDCLSHASLGPHTFLPIFKL